MGGAVLQATPAHAHLPNANGRHLPKTMLVTLPMPPAPWASPCMGAHEGSDKIANTDHFGTFHHCQRSQLSRLPSSQSQNKISQRTKVFAVTVLCKRSKTGNISFLSPCSLVSTSCYLAKTINNRNLCFFLDRTPTSLISLHATYLSAFNPGYLMESQLGAHPRL